MLFLFITGRKGAPHEWLFPQCSMAIHHGGAGTTGAALRAGTLNINWECPTLLNHFSKAFQASFVLCSWISSIGPTAAKTSELETGVMMC